MGIQVLLILPRMEWFPRMRKLPLPIKLPVIPEAMALQLPLSIRVGESLSIIIGRKNLSMYRGMGLRPEILMGTLPM